MLPLLWRGPVMAKSGYGTASRGYLYGLVKNNLKNIVCDIVDFGEPLAYGSPEIVSVISPIVSNKPVAQAKYFVLQHVGADQVKTYEKAKQNVLLTVWETNKLPDVWINNCNLQDAIIVPSKFCQEVFIESGVNKPVYVVPHGIYSELLNKYNPGDYIKFPSTDLMKFGSVFTWINRKGFDVLIPAFCKAFEGRTDVALFLLSTPIQLGERYLDLMMYELWYLLGLFPNHPPVYLWQYPVSDLQVFYFLRGLDCYVSTSRGEGVGLPILEASSLGIPVVATGWGGHTGYYSSELITYIPYELTPVQSMYWSPWYTSDQLWAEPDIDSLVDILRDVAINYDTYKQKAFKAQELTLQKYTWENAGAELKSVLSTIKG